jgi:polyferredoxin
MHFLLSYIKSHIYDLHALLVGTIIFVLILVWRESIDTVIANWVNKHLEERTEARKLATYRRFWGLIYLLIVALAFLFFYAVAFISPFVGNSVPASIISAAFAITELEFYKTFIQKKGR